MDNLNKLRLVGENVFQLELKGTYRSFISVFRFSEIAEIQFVLDANEQPISGTLIFTRKFASVRAAEKLEGQTAVALSYYWDTWLNTGNALRSGCSQSVIGSASPQAEVTEGAINQTLDQNKAIWPDPDTTD